MRKTIGMLIAACAAMIFTALPASAQQGVAGPVLGPPTPYEFVKPNVCGAPIPHTGTAFRYGDLVCVMQCLKPAEWRVCPTKSWWADSKDHRIRGPFLVQNNVGTGKFSEPCGVVCRPPGTAKIAYKTSGVATNGEPAWIVFEFPATLDGLP